MDASNVNGRPDRYAPDAPALATGPRDGEEEPRRSRAAAPPPGPGATCRRFFQLNGASILYSLSALSILYGMARLIGPVLAQSGALSETLPCIGALNLYELALLGVLLLVVLWRNVTDDAVSLAILIALFLIASGMALDTVANDDPNVAAAVAVACVGLAGLKVQALGRGVSLPLTGLLLAACGVILAWNVTMAPVMAHMIRHELGRAAGLLTAWQVGWVALLGSAALMLVHAARVPTGQARRAHGMAPFLKTPAMAWLFMSVLFVGAAVHQYALAYIFDVPVSATDWLPGLALAALVVLEVLRGYDRLPEAHETALACVPLAGTAAAIAAGLFDGVPALGVALLWHPPVWLALTGLGLARYCLQNGRRWLWCTVLAYMLAVVLTVGTAPTGLPALNWRACGLVVMFLLLAGGLLRQNATMLMAVVVFMAVGVARADLVGLLAQQYGPHTWAALATATAGLGTTAVYLLLPRALPRWVAIGGALMLALGTVYLSENGPGWAASLGNGVGVACVAALVWLRTRDMVTGAILGGPLVWAVYRGAQAAAAWRYVGLSFVLLAAGAIYSLRYGRATHDPASLSRIDRPDGAKS